MDLNKILFLLLSSICCAVYPQNEHMKFDRISAKDGLINDNILCIFKDSKGFMWFGAYGGLDCFDGYNHKRYNRNTEPDRGVRENSFHCIFEDKKGQMWFGTEGGLVRYIREKDTFIYLSHNINQKNSISNNKVRQIIQDEKGTFWVATYGGGLNKFISDSEKFVSYMLNKDDPFSIPNNQVNVIFIDSRKNFWIGTEEGLVLFNEKSGQFHTFKDKTGLQALDKNIIISSLYEDNKGNLWIGTWNNGLFIYNQDGNTIKNVNTIKGCSSCKINFNIRAISADKKGIIWCASRSLGILNFDPSTGNWRTFSNDPFDKSSLSYDLVWTIYIDDLDIVWAGTSGYGICTLDPSNHKFKTFQKERSDPNTISSNYITALFVDHSDNLWIGTELNGINKLNKKTGKYSTILSNSIIKSGTIRSFFEDENNFLWVGTDAGVYVYNDKDNLIKKYRNSSDKPYSISSHPIESICKDNEGNIWFATWGNGVYKLPSKEKLKNESEARFYNFKHDDKDSTSIASDIVWLVFLDKNNNLWIANEGALDRFEAQTGKFHHYKIRVVNSIFEDKDGLWISTFGDGIYLLNPKTDQLVLQTNKNPASAGIFRDSVGNLWIPSEVGLFEYNPKSTFSHIFNEKDGIIGNRIHQNSFAISRDGTVYLGGFNGYQTFNPDKIFTDTTQPRVIFTDFIINGKSVLKSDPGFKLKKPLLYTDTVILKYNQNNVAFEYVALQYSGAENIKYRYKLLPYDTLWNYTSAVQRKAIYTNLNPGSYQLIVESTNRDEVWSKHHANISIIIIPAWYQTLYFKLLILVLLGILIFLIFSYRVKRIKLQNLALEKLVDARTKELSIKNNLLSKQTNELSEINTILEEKQQQIEQQSEELLRINQTLNDKNVLLVEQAEYLKVANLLIEESRKQTLEQAEELMTQKEELIRVNSELNETNATKDKFFSIIAHDIKNPFNSILGFTELLQMNFSKWTEEKKLQIVNVLHSSSQNVYELLENLLQWSRSQRGIIEFNPDKVNLVDQVNYIFKLLKDTADDKEITLISDIESDDMYVLADIRMLHTILRNLIGNAIKFTHKGGIVKVVAETKNSRAEIKVIDNGVGIPADVLDKLFRIDYQHTTEGTNNERGTGLGLILSKEFAIKNGGTIHIESEQGKGSTFTFVIPLEEAIK